MSKTKLIYGPYGWAIGSSDILDGGACQCLVCNPKKGSETYDRRLTLLFKREALLYDVETIAYVEGDVMKSDSDSEKQAKHQTQDIGQDGNVDRATRILDLVHALCLEALHKFTHEECEDGTELTDDFKEQGVYAIPMNIPKSFSRTTANLLEKLIHEFMVCSVLADWLAITNPAKAEIWQAKAKAAMDKAKETLHNRSGVTTRPLHPW